MSRRATRSQRAGLPAPSFDEFWASEGLICRSSPTMAAGCAASATIPMATRAADAERQASRSSRRPSRASAKRIVPAIRSGSRKSDVPAPARRCFLVANQPATRLHSQLDFGGHSARSQASRPRGRAHESRATPTRAASADGDIIRLFNARGACLAGGPRHRRHRARRGPACRPAPGTIPMDPEDDAPLCVHGNPNVLTRDVGTSSLAQGCTGQLTTVEVETFHRQSAADPGFRSGVAKRGRPVWVQGRPRVARRPGRMRARADAYAAALIQPLP